MIINDDLLIIINDKMVNGAIFCHEDRIVQLIHDSDAITEGNHKWHGAIPSLITIDVTIIDEIINLLISGNHIDDADISISLEPKAWVKKYLIAASISWNLLE